MVRHQTAKFRRLKHRGSRDIVVLVAEEQNSKCSCLTLSFLFFS